MSSRSFSVPSVTFTGNDRPGAGFARRRQPTAAQTAPLVDMRSPTWWRRGRRSMPVPGVEYDTYRPHQGSGPVHRGSTLRHALYDGGARAGSERVGLVGGPAERRVAAEGACTHRQCSHSEWPLREASTLFGESDVARVDQTMAGSLSRSYRDARDGRLPSRESAPHLPRPAPTSPLTLLCL